MSLLPILEFPDPRLRTVAAPVDPAGISSPEFQRLLDDMFETMYTAPGIGLAASQVDVHQRFMVIDISEEHDQPLVFINPEITARDGDNRTKPFKHGGHVPAPLEVFPLQPGHYSPQAARLCKPAALQSRPLPQRALRL